MLELGSVWWAQAHRPSQPDGLPSQIVTNNDGPGLGTVTNAYLYNKRRLLSGQGETTSQNWYAWGIGYGYTSNGQLANHTYPTGLVVSYAPNALGQATAVTGNDGRTYASGVQYYPNGAISQFAYGNGIVHTMTQNARQLPLQVASGTVSGYQYGYDANGNPTHLHDLVQGGNYSRLNQYDGLDRLTASGSVSYGGDHWHRYTYDALDNLKSWKLAGVKDYANYVYDTSNRLTLIENGAGAGIVGLGYDPQGNLSNRNGQGYTFDYGNRLRGVPNQETYRYDGLGRRVQTISASGTTTLWQYTQAGQLLFSSDWTGPNFQNQKTHESIHLAESLIATVDHSWPTNAVLAVKYQHTDALGSPVAVSNEAGQVIDRTYWEPYGAAIGKPAYDGIGYTGHVMDGATGLTYMQQRYYDQQIGRFLSVDPVTAYEGDYRYFTRYAYAFNNPYKFIDPDGRENKLGVVVKYTPGFVRENNPTASDGTALAATQRSVDLTVNAAIASENPTRIADAKMWDVTVSPDLSSADGCRVACTGTTSSGGEKTAISTEYTGDIAKMSVENSGPYNLTDGLTSNGGDASLFHVGAHELAHGSDQNVAISSEAASERDVGKQVLDQVKSSPDIQPREIQRTR